MNPGNDLAVLVAFCRPHTVVATTVQVFGLFAVAGGHRWPIGVGLVPLATTLAACLALNVYVVGLNQLTDVPIDRINKPNLPLAADALSRRTAVRWVLAAGALALILGSVGGVFLLATIATIGLVGTAYSLPPLHLKRHALWAVLSVALARGVIANVGLLWHYQQLGRIAADGADPPLAPALTLLPQLVPTVAAFFFAFGLVIALYKDIPDVAGDLRYGVRTFAATWGPRKVFAAGQLVMSAAYFGIIAWAATWLTGGDYRMPMAHAGLLAAFWRLSSRTDPTEPAAMTRFYRELWVLFYLEFVVLALCLGWAPRR